MKLIGYDEPRSASALFGTVRFIAAAVTSPPPPGSSGRQIDSSSVISLREIFTDCIDPILYTAEKTTSNEVGGFIICMVVRFRRQKAVFLTWICVALLFD